MLMVMDCTMVRCGRNGGKMGETKDASPVCVNTSEPADDPLGTSKESLMRILSHIPIPVHYWHPQSVTEYRFAFPMGGAL